MVRAVSMILVFGLVATFLIGAIASSPAGATEARSFANSMSISSVLGARTFDTDGDGIENDNDSDIDGDQVINGIDPDIDGDGIANGSDGDPVGTLGDSPVKQVPPKIQGESNPFLSAGTDDPWVRLIFLAAILGLGVVIWSARRKR